MAPFPLLGLCGFGHPLFPSHVWARGRGLGGGVGLFPFLGGGGLGPAVFSCRLFSPFFARGGGPPPPLPPPQGQKGGACRPAPATNVPPNPAPLAPSSNKNRTK